MDWPHVVGAIVTGCTSLGLAIFGYWQSKDRIMIKAEAKHSVSQDKEIKELRERVKAQDERIKTQDARFEKQDTRLAACEEDRADIYRRMAAAGIKLPESN